MPKLVQHAAQLRAGQIRRDLSCEKRAAIAHVLERFVHREIDQEGSTRRFDLTPRVQTRSNNTQAARTPSHKCTPAPMLCV
ncbi:hypothetical protein F511_26506 [Dorcoceras hygrometricum]|uniref:Uncharacterized protein n=1 Tax=Dorcoceras hygrometricum TaxID=472368 RepID=A0A2Z7D4M6_9LAMI|nr:hypothetical protein F511_26506 [Dorcoceras hygrometricum]